MSQFIFAVEVPPVSENSHGMNVSPEWTKFTRGAKTIVATAKGTKEVLSNVWLLPAENSLPVLVELSNLASSCNLSYSSLLVEGVTDLSTNKKRTM